MKKKDAIILVGALSCLFFLLSFSLVFQLEDVGYREQLRRRRAQVEAALARGEDGQQISWFNEFFQPQCRCPKYRPHPIQGSTHAHELAIHATLDHDTCYVTTNGTKNNDVDIQVGDLLRTARLRYPQYVYHHTGWIQEMDVTYSARQWDKEKLRVFFVLHSHNDPGWLKTYSSYFSTFTKATLDRAVKFLDRDPDLRFVWAEVVYLRHWYREASVSQRRQLKKLIKAGRFEVVTGGWVMTDEAVAHYPAMLEQLINGHLWLNNTLGMTPRYGWAIDPFGHSPTMAYLLQRAGLEGAVLQRVHYALKQHLAYRKQLEFYWKQAWDGGQSDTGLLCHLMPFLYYSIPYSCGPDIQTCCRLDFTSSKCWAWGQYQKPEPVTHKNVRQLSEALLDQLRKKAQFYKHNVLLVPHGDDFRFSSDHEWKDQTHNLKTLFEYMNSQPHMNIKVGFGTVADYFDAVKASVATPTPSGHPQPEPAFPSLSGDFFTYTDRDDQYWSGYFSTRPVLKAAIRTLQARLRCAEILFTLGHTYALRKSPRLVSEYVTGQYRSLETARDTLGLLQHHDAVTGTSKEAVAADYLERAEDATRGADRLITHMTSLLLVLALDPSVDFTNFKLLSLDTVDSAVSVPEMPVKPDDKEHERMIIVHNPLAVERTDVISLMVTSPDVTVTDLGGTPVVCQVGPVWEAQTHISDTKFELSIEVTIPALGIARYILRPSPYDAGCQRATVRIFNGKPVATNRKVFHVRHHSVLDVPVTIENRALQATICACTGLLKTVTTKMDGTEHQTEARVVTYGTGSWSNPYRDKSGPYIFMPDGPGQEVQYENPVVVVTEGPLVSSVKTHVPLLDQKITLLNITGPLVASLRVENNVSIAGEQNLEVAIRFISDVINDDRVFYTDLNGFQMSRRQTLSRLPLQANFYPVTSSMWVEDDLFRLTALSAQSHGAASLHTGWMEFVLDRELEQGDWRGLNQGVRDNRPVTSSLLLLWETRRPTPHSRRPAPEDPPAPTAFPSLLAHLSSQLLDNPLVVRALHSDHLLQGRALTPVTLEPLNRPFPCDLHLVTLRSLGVGEPDVSALLVLQRVASDCNFPESYKQCEARRGKVRWTELFSQVRISSADRTLVTGVGAGRRVHHSYLTVQPMELATFRLVLS